jgi:hypothetical protein
MATKHIRELYETSETICDSSFLRKLIYNKLLVSKQKWKTETLPFTKDQHITTDSLYSNYNSKKRSFSAKCIFKLLKQGRIPESNIYSDHDDKRKEKLWSELFEHEHSDNYKLSNIEKIVEYRHGHYIVTKRLKKKIILKN